MCKRPVLVSLFVSVWVLAYPAFGQHDPQLVGWWTFNEGVETVVHDSSGQGHDGTFLNNPQWVPGVMGGALRFSGDDDQVELTKPLPIGASSNTVAVWIKVPYPGTEGLGASERVGNVLGNYADNPNSNWELHSNGQMRLWWNNGEINTYGTTDLRDNTWHHVAWLRDKTAGAVSMYIDGQPEATLGNIGTDIDFVTPHRIGGDNRADPPSFHGLMDDFQVYSRALSQDEIVMIMNGPIDYRMASSPQPVDEADDVPRDIVLRWSPGIYAATHDVYLGTRFTDVDEATRTNSLGVLASQGQTATTYKPLSTLDFEQTYYWRIDEVNAAPSSAIFKGRVWSFTVEPFAYTIEDVVATSNLVSPEGQGPENTVNGSGLNENEHSTDPDDMWTATIDPNEPEIIRFQFDRVYKMNEMLIWNHNLAFEALLGIGVKNVTVEYSTDGNDWTVLNDVEFPQAPGQATYTGTAVPLDGVGARFIRLVDASAWLSTIQIGLGEIRFSYIPAHAREPEPQDDATDVPPNAVLSWRAGREAATHDIYLGTDPDTIERVGSTTESRYDPAGLDLGTTYTWWIDEVNEADVVTSWASDVWTFSTQESLLIDDFESYTDDIVAEEAIWQSWLDGITDGKYGGSQVGYITSPFAEQTIVHSGRQSMPVIYNNSDSPFYAEAERVFDVPQNWSVYGIKTLSLYFRGEIDNDGQLYVKINGVKQLYDGDPDDIAKTVWQPWNIDLTTLGNEAANIRQLTIGIEGANTQGTLYIDDIRLYSRAIEYITPAEPDTGNRVGWWTFDEGSGSVAGDYSGLGNDATIETGDLQWVPGKIDGALNFDGIRHRLTLASPLTVGSSSNTVAVWVKVPLIGTGNLDANERVGVILGNWPDTPNSNWELHDDGQMRTYWNGGQINAYGKTDLRDNTWHHIVWVRDKAADAYYMYVDGHLEATVLSAGTDITFGTNHVIGADGRGASSLHFHGLMDDLQLYGEALSAAEIAWLAGLRTPIHVPF